MRNLPRNQKCELERGAELAKVAYQFGLWIQVDRAAPIPVPVQTRIPLLNMAEACPTPAILG